MYLQLANFKDVNGHCNASQNSTGEIGRWVKWQRNRYAATQKWLEYIDEHGTDHGYQNKDHTACLTKSQRDRLDAIGLTWYLKPDVLGWEGQFEDLLAYRETHGHWYVLYVCRHWN